MNSINFSIEEWNGKEKEIGYLKKKERKKNWWLTNCIKYIKKFCNFIKNEKLIIFIKTKLLSLIKVDNGWTNEISKIKE